MDDLNTVFIARVEALRDAHPLAVDSDTLVAQDLVAIRALAPLEVDDINTMYVVAL